MFGIGPAEMIVIAIVALVFIGPQRLPEVMRQLGKFFVQAKRTTAEFREVIDDTVKQAERELSLEEQRKALKRVMEMPKSHKLTDDSSNQNSHDLSKKDTFQQQSSLLRPEISQQEEAAQILEGSLSSTVRRDRPETLAVDWEAEQNLDLPPLHQISAEVVQKKEGSSHVPVG